MTIDFGDIVNIHGKPVQMMCAPKKVTKKTWMIFYRTEVGGDTYQGLASTEEIAEMERNKK
jgi:uncharacterized protein YecA (UPF0149 family)